MPDRGLEYIATCAHKGELSQQAWQQVTYTMQTSPMHCTSYSTCKATLEGCLEHHRFVYAHLPKPKKGRVQTGRETFAYGMPIDMASAIVQADLAEPCPAIAWLPEDAAALPCW